MCIGLVRSWESCVHRSFAKSQLLMNCKRLLEARKREDSVLSDYAHPSSFLGSAKLPISRIGIGTWAIGGGWGAQSDDDSLSALHEALDLGCQLFDTAPLYGNGHAEQL